MNEVKVVLNAKGLKIGIVCSRFNRFITQRLLEGALDAFLRHNGDEKNLNVFWVPGSFEIPLVLKKLANKKYDGLVALGSIIRGETPHFEYVAGECAKGIAKVSYDLQIPASFGIITADNIEQAIERAGGKQGNKGYDAVVSVIETINVLKQI
jgi:6,7-dimethyl-8-ribityllumazine synthase